MIFSFIFVPDITGAEVCIDQACVGGQLGGGPLQHDAVLLGKGLGMPKLGQSEYGDLFVHIDISCKMVEWSEAQRSALKTVFPEWTSPVPGGAPLKFQ